MVIFRSRWEDRVLVAMMAGTEQPKPRSMGTKLLPDRPIFRRSLSIRKAILAMYPESSRMDRKKNSTTTRGRKLSTLPTPAKTPSITRLCTTGFMPYAVRKSSTLTVSVSIPRAKRLERYSPIT